MGKEAGQQHSVSAPEVDTLDKVQTGLQFAFAAVSAANTVRMLVRLVKERKTVLSPRTLIAVGQAVGAILAVRHAIRSLRDQRRG